MKLPFRQDSACAAYLNLDVPAFLISGGYVQTALDSRWPAHILPLDINAAFAVLPEAMAKQIIGEGAAGCAGGRLLRDSVERRKIPAECFGTGRVILKREGMDANDTQAFR